MTIRKWTVLGSVVQLLLFVALPAASSAFADEDAARVQLCWVLGKFDDTVYFAEIEGREDRRESFVALIDISGIDHHPVECLTSDSRSHRLVRNELMKKWSDSEFEIVNTTFMSDLDY